VKILTVQFRNGVTVHPGGQHGQITSWRADKHHDIPCEELKNGDVALTILGGARVVLRPWAIDYITYAPEPKMEAKK
jgi:hypothetical protein